ncbi:MAG: alpha/beta hydrolase [Patescibacteria group bacterium]|nr:alpha/beta hydrolase [Patescibacteria group bacterium]
MPHTKLIEFSNTRNKSLRGLLLRQNSDKLVLMCGGFERRTTTELKFKKLADLLETNNISSFRFDYSGCGLSDGDFSKTAVKTMADELLLAIKAIKKEVNFEILIVAAHSLSACVVANLAKKKLFEKIILLAPALNQKNLLRYWFTKSNAKEEINWKNYKQYFNEFQFEADCKKEKRMTKSNFIGSGYFLENKEKDYSDLLINTQNILHIHGEKDNDVPLESVNIDFPNQLIIEDGNHDLEKPDIFEIWSQKVINFIQ